MVNGIVADAADQASSDFDFSQAVSDAAPTAAPPRRQDERRVTVTMYAAIIGGRPTVDPSLRPLDRSRRHGLLRRHRDGLPVLADVADWIAGVGTAAARRIAPSWARDESRAH